MLNHLSVEHRYMTVTLEERTLHILILFALFLVLCGHGGTHMINAISISQYFCRNAEKTKAT